MRNNKTKFSIHVVYYVKETEMIQEGEDVVRVAFSAASF